jgi:hypothetical protein
MRWDDGSYDDDYDVPHLEVEVTSPVELGRLLNADGSVLRVMYDRAYVPVGFQVPGE